MHLLRMFTRVCCPSILLGSIALRAPLARADTHTEARVHFDAAVRAFEERRFGDAAQEFERAYRLEPAWQVLYNLGSVYAALGRPVEAIDAFERYVSAGAAHLDEERRREVQAELARQRAKLAFLEVFVNERNAEIRVDLRVVGRSPLAAPVRLAEGAHLIEVTLEGRSAQRREVQLVRGQRSSTSFTLLGPSPPPAPTATSVEASTAVTATSNGTGQRIVGYALGGVGLVGLGVGIGVLAKGQSKHLDAVDTANAGERPRAERMESEAEHQKTLGFATMGVSGTFVLGGLVLLITAPHDSPRVSLGLSPWLAASAGGLDWNGTW